MRAPMATALALMSLKWQRLTLLPCEPIENEMPFEPRWAKRQPVKLTLLTWWNWSAAGVSRWQAAVPPPLSVPRGHVRQNPACTSTKPRLVDGPIHVACSKPTPSYVTPVTAVASTSVSTIGNWPTVFSGV